MSRLKVMLKETFAAFNASIDRIYTHQSGWTIPDHMLRSAVKRVIKDDLLDTYQAFMRRCGPVVGRCRRGNGGCSFRYAENADVG
jgi:hypothetical protein